MFNWSSLSVLIQKGLSQFSKLFARYIHIFIYIHIYKYTHTHICLFNLLKGALGSLRWIFERTSQSSTSQSWARQVSLGCGLETIVSAFERLQLWSLQSICPEAKSRRSLRAILTRNNLPGPFNLPATPKETPAEEKVYSLT